MNKKERYENFILEKSFKDMTREELEKHVLDLSEVLSVNYKIQDKYIEKLERYKNSEMFIVDELEKYLKEEERINNGIIINLTSGNVARMDAGVKNGVLDKVLDKLKELKGE